MKKTFQLTPADKKPERVLEAIKHEIRQYLKRERRKDLPESADYWDFDCQFGATPETATSSHLGNLMTQIDALASQGAPSFYLLLLAKPAVRQRTPQADLDAESEIV